MIAESLSAYHTLLVDIPMTYGELIKQYVQILLVPNCLRDFIWSLIKKNPYYFLHNESAGDIYSYLAQKFYP